MGIEAGMVVVDLCCGDGLFTAPLCGMASRVYAIDIDPEMLDRAKHAFADASNCQFIVGDAMNIQAVVPEPVDYIFLANTFHGVPDKAGLLRAAASRNRNTAGSKECSCRGCRWGLCRGPPGICR